MCCCGSTTTAFLPFVVLHRRTLFSGGRRSDFPPTKTKTPPDIFQSSTMLELIEIFIIAVAQGIGEFLPISSSGHNAVLNHLFERFGEPLTNNSAEFVKLNILLHAGSLVAVLIVFRQRIFAMLGKDWHLIPMIIVATLPAVAVGLPIHKFCPWLEDYLPLISACFLGTGILLLWTLRLPEGEKTTSTMTWTDALIIGCSQAVAVLPGLSRSGTTIVTGLFCRLKREESAAFSFILSIPVIAGAGLLECYSMYKKGIPEPSEAAIPDWLLLTGAAVSCVVGIIALVFLLDWLKKGKLWYFALWVFVMSPITLALFLTMPENRDHNETERPNEIAVVHRLDSLPNPVILTKAGI